MKRVTLINIIIIALFHSFVNIYSQDLPILNSRMVNSFLYNPSLAGGAYNTIGAFYFINKSSFNRIDGNPVTNLIGAHYPIQKYKVGIGANLFVDNVNVFQTIYTSIAMAYHIQIFRESSLSFGLSGDLYSIQLKQDKLHVVDENAVDPELEKYADNKLKPDFSFGLNFDSEKWSAGGTINRLLTTGIFNKDENRLSDYYSLYLKHRIFIRSNTRMLEPQLTYRKLPSANPLLALGMYYCNRRTYLGHIRDQYFILGASVGTNSTISVSTSIKLLKRVELSYTCESLGKYYTNVGLFHEIMLSYDIIDLSYKERTTEYLVFGERWLRFKRFINKKIFKRNM